MSFRLTQILPQYFTDDGQVLAGGYLKFYENGTETPKPTYLEPALTNENADPLVLLSDGRPPQDVWGSGVYSVELYSPAGVLLNRYDNVQESGTELPDPSTGPDEFLMSNGTDYVLAAIEQVPDSSGASVGDVLQILTGPVVGWDSLPLPSDFDGDTIENAVFLNCRETIQTVAATTTTTLDYALGAIVILNQAVDIGALSITNLSGGCMTIVRKKDATATPRLITWSGVLFAGGTDPTLTQTSSAVDVFTVISDGVIQVGSGAAAFS